ncbi:hypothetical protein C9374_004680 [Naegleria lovaniensis]|uniref:Uncharacterized protein n=1 Tax=Naegleria lovaniensis TaxID=51637 RepID=A0AA88KKS4_NAELO|nr:uncharacterized protein C9374_004680 [Naegleria lovaniensis]KAG2383343.1 hypothetical protein C9374_004680 [Naegleria lovaniensis]
MVLKNILPFLKTNSSPNSTPTSQQQPNYNNTNTPFVPPIPLSPRDFQEQNDHVAAQAVQTTQTTQQSSSPTSPRSSNCPSNMTNSNPVSCSPRNGNNPLVAFGQAVMSRRTKRAYSVATAPEHAHRTNANRVVVVGGSAIPSSVNSSPTSTANQVSSSPQNYYLRKTNEERKKELLQDFEMRKVIIYSNCKRLRALLDVLIERARPHQIQNVSYVLAQISIVNSTGLSPTTETDLKIVKQELNMINLEVFRLSLLLSESCKREYITEEELLNDPKIGNLGCESVILKILLRELSEMEKELERMHRKCRANKKKPQETPQPQPPKKNGIFGRRRNNSALERPTSMVLEKYSQRRNSLDYYRSPTMEELGQETMNKVKERVSICQFRTVTKELHLDNGIELVLQKRFEEMKTKLANTNPFDIDIYNPLPSKKELLSEEYWKKFLENHMGFSDIEFSRPLSNFVERIAQEGDSITSLQTNSSSPQHEASTSSYIE